MADTCHKSNQNVNVLSNKLAQITKELDELKKEMDGKSGSISDTSPIFQIKSALKTLKKEIAELDLNIGVVVSLMVFCRRQPCIASLFDEWSFASLSYLYNMHYYLE